MKFGEKTMSIAKACAPLAALVCLAAAPGAFAAPDALFGNTLQVTAPDGTAIKVLVNADGTYSRNDASGVTVTGTWTETGDQICFTAVKPVPRPEACTAKITQKVGDTWTMNISGTPATATIVAGR